MTPGPKRVPTERLAPEFVKAIKADGRLTSHLSLLAGFSSTGLSDRLYKPFPATGLTMRRITRIAEEIGYTGELLAAPEEKPSLEDAAKEARPVLAQAFSVLGNIPLPDAASVTNAVVDAAVEGRLEPIRALRAALRKLVELSDEAEAAASNNSNNTTPEVE